MRGSNNISNMGLIQPGSSYTREPTAREKDPGITFSQRILGKIFLIIILCFLLNLFLAFLCILAGPIIIFPMVLNILNTQHWPLILY